MVQIQFIEVILNYYIIVNETSLYNCDGKITPIRMS